MKNITVSVPDEVYRRARVRAAEKGTSLSAVVRQVLTSFSTGDAEFERLERLQVATLARVRKNAGYDAAKRLSRDEVHERRALR